MSFESLGISCAPIAASLELFIEILSESRPIFGLGDPSDGVFSFREGRTMFVFCFRLPGVLSIANRTL